MSSKCGRIFVELDGLSGMFPAWPFLVIRKLSSSRVGLAVTAPYPGGPHLTGFIPLWLTGLCPGLGAPRHLDGAIAQLRPARWRDQSRSRNYGHQIRVSDRHRLKNVPSRAPPPNPAL